MNSILNYAMGAMELEGLLGTFLTYWDLMPVRNCAREKIELLIYGSGKISVCNHLRRVTFFSWCNSFFSFE